MLSSGFSYTMAETKILSHTGSIRDGATGGGRGTAFRGNKSSYVFGLSDIPSVFLATGSID